MPLRERTGCHGCGPGRARAPGRGRPRDVLNGYARLSANHATITTEASAAAAIRRRSRRTFVPGEPLVGLTVGPSTPAAE
jgi:hypothetical protein